MDEEAKEQLFALVDLVGLVARSEITIHVASAMRRYYEALIAEGFSREQAFELVKVDGANILSAGVKPRNY